LVKYYSNSKSQTDFLVKSNIKLVNLMLHFVF